MTFGLKEEQKEDILTVFKNENKINEVVIFGSRAKGNYKPGSDIDLALKGSLDLNDLLKLYNKLDDINLPYKFDLIIYEQIKDKDVIEHIKRVGISLFKRNGND